MSDLIIISEVDKLVLDKSNCENYNTKPEEYKPEEYKTRELLDINSMTESCNREITNIVQYLSKYNISYAIAINNYTVKMPVNTFSDPKYNTIIQIESGRCTPMGSFCVKCLNVARFTPCPHCFQCQPWKVTQSYSY